MSSTATLDSPRFPRAANYHPEWIKAGVSGGANPLWMTEWLAEAMTLKPGMRVLDLGCGRALSSVFLHREFGAQVWAADLWFSVSENFQRIRDAGAEHGVYPVYADARALPFARDFFDAIISIDSFPYYGTDEMYLPSLARLVKPGGQIGIAGAGFTREFDQGVPAALRPWWTPELNALHSAAWWRSHWEKTGFMNVECAETLPDGWRLWRDWLEWVSPENDTEIAALEADQGAFLGYYRVVGRRDGRIELPDPVNAVPSAYARVPMLRPQHPPV